MLRLYLISSWIHHEFTDAAALPIHPALDRSAVLGRDHLPIVQRRRFEERLHAQTNRDGAHLLLQRRERDRKSTRLNSSHLVISYAVFCLKKKKTYAAHRMTTS